MTASLLQNADQFLHLCDRFNIALARLERHVVIEKHYRAKMVLADTADNGVLGPDR